MNAVSIIPLPGLPEIQAGDDLADRIALSADAAGWVFESGDILVIAQKIVSKAENRITVLADVSPSARAVELSKELNTDARKVEVVLNDSARVIRVKKAPGPNETGVIITETHSGFICANAGVDESNTGSQDVAISLPLNPDKSAKTIQKTLLDKFDIELGIIISDTFGRPWRIGETNIAIGLAGVPAIIDLRGEKDRDGKILKGSRPAFADELASASGLVSGKSAGLPVTLIRGIIWTSSEATGRDLLRPPQEDMFR